MAELPIDSMLPELRRRLADGPNLVLTAAPGAGKTTRVPLALLDESWMQGKRMLILEPRRLAARAAAAYMARTLGQEAGQTVGYRIRLDAKIGPSTRVEVVTEGVLSRLLQHDPGLTAYGAVLLDEFHERSLHADLGLALCLDSQRHLRPDLRILVMSATMDSASVSGAMGGAPVLSCEGRQHPVDTRYVERPRTSPIEEQVAGMILSVLAQEQGSLLVFLPGVREIRRVARLIESRLGGDVGLALLFGDLSQAEQDRAIATPPSGRRKIVLSTSIAETSLTIEGIRIVIDSGLMRVPRHDPRSGLTRLDTIPVTRDCADQRRGRAGRLGPGLCFRLWTEGEHRTLRPHRPPEILEADLTGAVLDLAAWGVADPGQLAWLDLPPAGAVGAARELLARLGALDEKGGITPHGRRMAELPMHPRLAHMLLRARSLQLAALGADLAALLTERDVLRTGPANSGTDVRTRVDLLHEGGRSTGPEGQGQAIDHAALHRAREISRVWRRQLAADPHKGDRTPVGMLLAFAYPDRIAQRMPGPDPRYRLANGRGALFTQPDPLGTADYLVVADLDGAQPWSRIALAAPVALDDLRTHCAALIRTHDRVWWDAEGKTVRAQRQERLGELVLREQPLRDADPAQVTHCLLQGIAQEGLACLPWTDATRAWQARVLFLHRLDGDGSAWPDVSESRLLDSLPEWLGPHLEGMTRLEQVRRLDLQSILTARLTWDQQRALDRLAPPAVAVPSGSRIRLDYRSQEIPVLAVRLQELFGCRATPRVADGRVPVLLHLLSPAGRPAAVTQDLERFWATAYPEVRKELRGRYPKHAWPEDPLTAHPTSRPARRP